MTMYRNEFQQRIEQDRSQAEPLGQSRLAQQMANPEAAVSAPTDNQALIWSLLFIATVCAVGLLRPIRSSTPTAIAEPSSLRIAIRMIFNMAITPLLLGGALVAAAMIAKWTGLFETR